MGSHTNALAYTLLLGTALSAAIACGQHPGMEPVDADVPSPDVQAAEAGLVDGGPPDSGDTGVVADSAPPCGNGVLDVGEVCDGSELAGQTCAALGYQGGILVCTDACLLDEQRCYVCGDGHCVVSGGETQANCPSDCGWTSINAGFRVACGTQLDGAVWCWGSNWNGGLGVGSNVGPETCGGVASCSRTPVQVPGLQDGVHVSIGGHHSIHNCSLLGDGTVWCWGVNGVGQLGDGTTVTSHSPVQVSGLLDATAVEVGEFHTCAVDVGGSVWCWGHGYVLGIGDPQDTGECSSVCRTVPQLVPGLTDIVSLCTGRWHSCAVDIYGGAWCWGDNGDGQLGDGTLDDHTTPTPVANLADVQNISCGFSHTCAVTGDGTVWCWGGNSVGQLGVSPSLSEPLPQPVAGIPAIAATSGGVGHTCATADDGTAWCWGYNVAGELGLGFHLDQTSPPSQVQGLPGVVSVSAGHWHTCALDTQHGAWCWGGNGSGQLGVGIDDGPEYCPPYGGDYCSSIPQPVGP